MPDPTTLFVARHGETVWNVEGRAMGHLDSDLTELGMRQAAELAARMRDAGLDVVYASDLGRARRTGEVVASACGVELAIEPGLRERHMGIFQGLTAPEMEERHPAEWRAYKTAGPMYVIPGGESATQRTERSVSVMTGIAERHPGKRVGVVTHGGFVTGFFEHVIGAEPGTHRAGAWQNGRVSVFGYASPVWTLLDAHGAPPDGD